ncbi:putative E3 ubiquitin-protein ligase HECTD1 [Paratrimastix pyriformis]|uniref:E3 ubiquitin-protein ligase HECTD1 n=1 Tax=Paratrimastix pyriformis TaxID=342808 RepID=A0ABQ8UDR4_9EUKA|nr:putative E3 ubiquitin-protein ligase HECTD1 [Paratrimastix pyriformis]
MDERGLFYYIGTQGGTQPWQNPAEAGWVTATRSTVWVGKASDALGRQACLSFTNSDEPALSWWRVDLGAGLLFKPARYTLRHSNDVNYAEFRLQSWRLEGSEDGGVSWRTLDEHTNEPNAIPACSDAMATFAVAPERAFPALHFRVLMTGPSPNGYHRLFLSGFEMYGEIVQHPATSSSSISLLPCLHSFPTPFFPMVQTTLLAGGDDSNGPSATPPDQHNLEEGLFHYIGTQGRTQPWRNPAEAGWVTATRSSEQAGKASDLTGRQPCDSFTNSDPAPSWWQVDLGAGRLFTPTRYILRSCSTPDYVGFRPQSWRLEGSLDGADGSWRTLDERPSDDQTALPECPDAMATFAVARERAFPARRFRVLMTGPTFNGCQNLVLGGLEMCGYLIVCRPAAL